MYAHVSLTDTGLVIFAQKVANSTRAVVSSDVIVTKVHASTVVFQTLVYVWKANMVSCIITAKVLKRNEECWCVGTVNKPSL